MPVKVVHRDERILSLTQIVKLYQEFKRFCLKSMRIGFFSGGNARAKTLLLPRVAFLPVHGTCLH